MPKHKRKAHLIFACIFLASITNANGVAVAEVVNANGVIAEQDENKNGVTVLMETENYNGVTATSGVVNSSEVTVGQVVNFSGVAVAEVVNKNEVMATETENASGVTVANGVENFSGVTAASGVVNSSRVTAGQVANASGVTATDVENSSGVTGARENVNFNGVTATRNTENASGVTAGQVKNASGVSVASGVVNSSKVTVAEVVNANGVENFSGVTASSGVENASGVTVAIATSENYAEWSLENGMKVFVFEDFSNATIQLDFVVKAGTLSQTPYNTGFFNLYADVFKKTAKSNTAKNLTSECGFDATHYKMVLTPPSFFSALEYLSSVAFSPDFSEDDIKTEYEKLKNERNQYSSDTQDFINLAIDSKVFSSEIYRHDTKFYPGLYKKKTQNLQAILNDISKNWYAPENCAIFITGCIKKEDAFDDVKKTFGKYSPREKYCVITKPISSGEKRKFVLVDSDFSSDMTQIALQYTSLSERHCNIAAEAYNSPQSAIKQLLLRQRNLAIRGDEYINVSASFKNQNSRLVFQSLLESPVNKKVNLAEQAELFVSKVQEGIKNTKDAEYAFSKKMLADSFYSSTSSPVNFMQTLSQFWVRDEKTVIASYGGRIGAVADKMLLESSLIFSENSDAIKKSLGAEYPYVFVLMNSEIYQKNKKFFQKHNYTELHKKDVAWYNEKIPEVQNHFVEWSGYSGGGGENAGAGGFGGKVGAGFDGRDGKLRNFVDENKNDVSFFSLSNEIPVILKAMKATNNVVFLISIAGGKFYSKKDVFFENAMVNAFASNIQKEADKHYFSGDLQHRVEIEAKMLDLQSVITVECAKEDAMLAIKAISDALIFSEITPFQADGAVYAVQTQKRLFNASAVNQMFFSGIKYFEKSSGGGVSGGALAIFDSENDVLQDVNYSKILSSYPDFLDAGLYKIFVVGNFDEKAIKNELNDAFGGLTKKGEGSSIEQRPMDTAQRPAPKTIKAKIRHLFYTDVKAKDAGPMPAVLVPTKNFLDPVQFWFSCPSGSQKEKVVFDAIAYRLKEILEENSDGIFSSVQLTFENEAVPYCVFSFLQVSSAQKISAIFDKCVLLLLEKLQGNESIKETQNIFESWILNALSKTASIKETALLLADKKNNPLQYIENYENLQNTTDLTYRETLEKYFKAVPTLKIYSADAK